MIKKQSISLILALLVMSTRVGFALNVHYCGHQIANISLASNPSNCGMEMEQNNHLSKQTSFSKTPCCKDQTLLFQNLEPQKVEAESNLVFFGLERIFCGEVLTLHSIPVVKNVLYSEWSPPPPGNQKIFLLNLSFVFYG